MTDTAVRTDAGLADRVNAANAVGMAHALWARLQPDRPAVIEAQGRTRSFAELNAAANRVARRLREAGLKPGDAVALVCSNRVEFAEVLSGALRIGLRLTPVNWHLTPDEIAYVVGNCEARALFADVRVAGMEAVAAACPELAVKVAIGGEIPGFETYDDIQAAFDGGDVERPVAGITMLYTSGTTGRPKGVFKPQPPSLAFDPAYDQSSDLHMCTGPAYHAAPLLGDIRRPLMNGVGTVLMDKWDSELVLKTIDERRVTRGHFVAIMFQRLLALPDEVKARYDLSSLRTITHGAAPCPPEVKKAMIDWVGPKLSEYYAGSEGGAGFRIDSHEWLSKPGSVGRRPHPDAARILDDEGNDCPVGVAGTIYMALSVQGGFEYFKDPAKTEANRRDGYFTLGDVGYLDEDDYLFLTGRSAETIIAGGVNIYPQEIDNALIEHPAVEDSCTVGAPHPEWGEEVRAVIQLKPGVTPSEALKAEILAHAAGSLAKFKVPRGLDFDPELPRSAAGKILRGKVRARYWEGRARQI
ncbi:MAG TPA: AMP-binding protein [Caulobacteraceae bacterium]|nr:AMP-binding protein [Caulobacteraceae bacterium]